MHKLRGSPGIIVLLFYFICLWNRTAGLCPSRCFCYEERLLVNCKNAALDIVPITLNPELRELRLNNNHIKGVRGSFSVYRNLDLLDVSHNQLVTLDKESFSGLKHLKILLLSQNMISSLQNETFKDLANLNVLHLNENFLDEVSPGIFTHLDKLELLDLNQNRISSVDDDAFLGLKNLKTLLLRDNKLTNIPSESFQPLSKLFKLDLGLNSFVDIPDNSFSHLNNLEELCLDGCVIRSIQSGAFKWLNSLLVLRIDDNELREVPTKSLFDVIRLEELYLGQNKFRELKSQSFQRLEYLCSIELNGAPYLERIDRGAFTDNINLKKVVFNHNKALRHIQIGAFDNLPNVRHVSLRGNAFQTLPYSLLPWDELQFLDVRDNPFVCNCSLMWLWKLLMTKNLSSSEEISDITRVVCAGPAGLEDRIIVDLPSEDLNCYSLNARRQIIIGVMVAAAVAAAAIVMLGFRYRDKVAGVLKTKWGRGRKEPQYQKTSAEEESTILQAAQQSLKMTPVTEL